MGSAAALRVAFSYDTETLLSYRRSEDNDTCFLWGLSQLCGAGMFMGRRG